MGLADKILTINSLLKKLNSLQPLEKEDEDRLWKKFRLEWNYNSNHIEGNTLTYGETMLLLINGKTTGDHELREYEEVKAHDVAIGMIKEWAADSSRKITEADIRALNKVILVEPFWKEAMTYDGQLTRRLIKIGDYKEHPNSVRLSNGEMFHYTSPQDTPQKMQEMMEWYGENIGLPAVVLAAELHHRFVSIHPFDDGNGRIARLLVNYVLMQNALPPVIIKSSDKSNYLTALQKADTGNKEAFHEYISDQLIWSLEKSIKAAKGESVEDEDDVDKEIELLKREKKGNYKVHEKKSREVLKRIYKENFERLFSDVENRLAKFDELFNERENLYSVQDSISTDKLGISGNSNKHIEEHIFFDFDNPARFGHISGGGGYSSGKYQGLNSYPNIYIIRLSYNWRGYNNGAYAPFNVSTGFEIIFEDYRYSLKATSFHDTLLVKFYDQLITDSEIKEIGNKLAKNVLQQIHENTKNKRQ